MIIANMSGTWVTAKALWLIFMLSLAAGASPVKQYKKKDFIVQNTL